jgi:hypothetical protein
MATKQTSIFADEEKLREKVSKLYGNFCSMEAKPNKIQLESIETLEIDYKEQSKKLQEALDKYLPKINL